MCVFSSYAFVIREMRENPVLLKYLQKGMRIMCFCVESLNVTGIEMHSNGIRRGIFFQKESAKHYLFTLKLKTRERLQRKCVL